MAPRRTLAVCGLPAGMGEAVGEGEMNAEQAHLLSLLIGAVSTPETYSALNLDQFVRLWGLDRARTYNALVAMHMDYTISFYAYGKRKPRPDDDQIIVRIPKEFYGSTMRLREPKARRRVSFDRATREAIHAQYGWRCVYCGAPSEEIDHVIPLSRGGGNDESNLVASCQRCNRTKSARLLDELGWSIRYG